MRISPMRKLFRLLSTNTQSVIIEKTDILTVKHKEIKKVLCFYLFSMYLFQ